ncbi:hypothetical protein ACJIZ3_004683 [Penstemon smallii]|uniref:Uncharacterized protein n=1 Tax=Penstemon smallii TaxID=265156 RepID=A0ABD3S2T0_9LAMI
MPTFTAIAFDTLIEPGTSKSMAPVRISPDLKLERRHSTPNTKQNRGENVPSSNLENGVIFPPKLQSERGVSVPPNVKLDRGVYIPSNSIHNKKNAASIAPTSGMDKKHHWTKISPALYATPESTPLPDSPSSFPPSPYIINHKRRGPRLMKSYSDDDVLKQPTDEIKVDENVSAKEEELVSVAKDDDSFIPKEVLDSTMDANFISIAPRDGKEEYLNGVWGDERGSSGYANGSAGQNGVLKSDALTLEQDGYDDDFVDPQDSMSVKSVEESEGNAGAERSLNSITPMGEFFDAWEGYGFLIIIVHNILSFPLYNLFASHGSELSSESGSQHLLPDMGNELREIRLSLLMEIEKRKQAEETLNSMRNQWQRIREQLLLVGLTLPVDPTSPEGDQPADPAADMWQQIYLARFVSNSIGRGTAKAEVEMEMEAQIKLKNIEIARLWDRLHYYEAVNQEMSQRNQEVVETARRLRQRRKRTQRWVWGSIATIIVTVGSATLAYSYFKSGKGSSSTSPMHGSGDDHESN